jgi:hypothetical protein
MAFDHYHDREQLIQSVIDSGFLPPHPEALASVINTLWLPFPSERPDTLDGLLLDVLMTFNTLASELVSARELPPRCPSLVIPFLAAGHACAIADALAFLGAHTDQCIPASAMTDARDEMRARWLDAIVGLCNSAGSDLWHLSPNGYVAMTSSQLGFSIEAFREIPRISLDPDDPIIGTCPRPSPEDRQAKDPDLEARSLVWRAAAAICVAACSNSGFRFGLQPSRS